MLGEYIAARDVVLAMLKRDWQDVVEIAEIIRRECDDGADKHSISDDLEGALLDAMASVASLA